MILGVLGSSAFAFGLLAAVAAKVPQLDPNKQHTQANTYVYASDGHTILTILRGSQARIVVQSAGDLALDEARDRRGRGQALLRAPRRRRPRHGACALGRRHASRRRAGRLDDHAAVRQERLPDEQEVDRPQALRGGARLAARAEVDEGPDPHRVPEHDLPRQPRLRRRAGEPRLLQAQREDADPGRGRPARGDPRGPEPLRPGGAPRRREGPPQSRPARPLPAAVPDARPADRRPERTDAGSATASSCPPSRRRGTRRRTSRTTSPTSSCASTARARPSAAVCASGRRSTSACSCSRARRSSAPSRRSRPATGRAPPSSRSTRTPARYSRWSAAPNYHKSQFNLATQGQRQPGSSFKPFVLAAALEQHIAPSSILQSKPVTIDAGGRLWQVRNFEGDYLGPINLATGDRRLRQLRLLAAHRARRPAEGRGSGPRARHHVAAQGLLLDRARRRVDDPARHGTRLRLVRRRRVPHRRLGLRQRAAHRRLPRELARATARRRTSRC